MTTQISAEDLLVRMQYTPNPMALKFVANHPFKLDGKATFNTAIEAESLPLIRDLFSVQGVRQVYAFQNTLTITHDGTLDEDQLCEQVTTVIKTRFGIHDPTFGDAESPATVRLERPTHDNPVLEQMEEVLDRTIRPGLQADGGDLELVKLEGNDLYIFYQGACGGCPSSLMGTLDAIQGILRYEMQNDELCVIPV